MGTTPSVHITLSSTAIMIIYKDILTDDEIISDVYDLKEIDGVVYEADCKMIKIDVVHSFRLQSTQFDKKGYLTYLKGYMKAVKAKLPEDHHAAFEKGASGYAKKIVASFKDWEFYTGESMDPDGMIVLLNYRDDGITPYVVVWKHGLSEMKV